jgi:Skp family chaperone for outer membrane proteins
MVTALSVRAGKHLLLCLFAMAAIWGCTASDDTAASAPPAVAASAPDAGRELETLRAEVARLQAENEQLRLSPWALTADLDHALAMQDRTKAEVAWQRLARSFPHSKELGPARKRVEALQAQLQAAQEESKRVAALGFKALRVNPFFMHADTTLRLTEAGLARRWIFDSYGHGWRYLDSEKGQRMLTTRVTVTSKAKNPVLFGIGAYVADGATMTQVGTLRYRFVRWLDFGAFLGNHADFRNDFTHHSRIPFSAGAALNDDVLKRRPLYLVVTREGCHSRLHDRMIQPPVHYVPGSCASLKKTLTVEDFKDGSLAVLQRID